MSSFFAPSYLTYPLSCFLANDRPPDGAAEAACIAFVFLPNYIAELLAGYEVLELFWTEIAWKVAWGAGSLAFVSVLLPLIYIVFCCVGTWMPSKRFVFRPWIGPPRLELAAGICMEAAAAWDCAPAKDRRTSLVNCRWSLTFRLHFLFDSGFSFGCKLHFLSRVHRVFMIWLSIQVHSILLVEFSNVFIASELHALELSPLPSVHLQWSIDSERNS